MEIDFLQTDRVAVIGVAKNSGKTTTLNALIGVQAARTGSFGLVSIGIDGESVDALLGIDKPSLWLPEGTLVASAHRALEASQARFELIEALGFSTPMGETVIARVRQAGDVLLAGMRHRDDVRRACEHLENWGARRVFVDGAYDRMSAASGDVAGGVFLSTGAILGSRVETIVKKTRPWLERIQLPAAESKAASLIERALEAGAVLAQWSGGEVTRSPGSALGGLDDLPRSETNLEFVAVPGLVSDSVVDALLTLEAEASRGRPTLIVRDPTVFRLDPETWHRLQGAWDLRVAFGTRLLGVAVNPTGVRGERVSRRALIEGLRDHCACPIFDPLGPTTPSAGFNNERSVRG